MNFIYPYFLYALAALSIPIVIHLFNFRRYKKVFFTNVRLLQSVQQETKSRSRLKHLLILFSRLLAIAFLVFAFAQPYIPVNNKKINSGERNISIYIDNSFSMNALTNNGTALETAKTKADAIIKAYEPTANFQLLDNGFKGKDQHFFSRSAILTHLSLIQPTAKVKNADQVLKRIEALQNSKPNQDVAKEIYFISDFQKNAFNIAQHHFDSSIHYHLVPIEAQTKSNIYIDSCWFSNPVHNINTDEELNVKIVNAGEKTILNAPLKLFINGQIKSPASFSLDPNESKVFKLNFKNTSTGIKTGTVKIYDNPITFDDQLFFSFNVAENIRVLTITTNDSQTVQENPLKALFKNDDFIKYQEQNIHNIDFGSLSNQSLIILDNVKSISNGLSNTLNKYVEDGGNVLFFPAQDIDLDNINTFISSFNGNSFLSKDTTQVKANNLNLNQEILKNVFTKKPKDIAFPAIKLYFKSSQNSRVQKEKILSLENNDDFLTVYPYKKGKFYLCSSPLSSSAGSFSKNALFVPIIYNIALFSQRQASLYYTIGENQGISLPSDDVSELFHIKAKDFDIVPGKRVTNGRVSLYDYQQIEKAEIYDVTLKDSIITKIAFNFNRKESELKRLTVAQISDKIKSLNTKASIDIIDSKAETIGKKIKNLNKGIPLWKYCIILALLFLAIEICLIKFLK